MPFLYNKSIWYFLFPHSHHSNSPQSIKNDFKTQKNTQIAWLSRNWGALLVVMVGSLSWHNTVTRNTHAYVRTRLTQLSLIFLSLSPTPGFCWLGTTKKCRWRTRSFVIYIIPLKGVVIGRRRRHGTKRNQQEREREKKKKRKKYHRCTLQYFLFFSRKRWCDAPTRRRIPVSFYSTPFFFKFFSFFCFRPHLLTNVEKKSQVTQRKIRVEVKGGPHSPAHFITGRCEYNGAHAHVRKKKNLHDLIFFFWNYVCGCEKRGRGALWCLDNGYLKCNVQRPFFCVVVAPVL